MGGKRVVEPLTIVGCPYPAMLADSFEISVILVANAESGLTCGSARSLLSCQALPIRLAVAAVQLSPTPSAGEMYDERLLILRPVTLVD